jgi:hypothetical protein
VRPLQLYTEATCPDKTALSCSFFPAIMPRPSPATHPDDAVEDAKGVVQDLGATDLGKQAQEAGLLQVEDLQGGAREKGCSRHVKWTKRGSDQFLGMLTHECSGNGADLDRAGTWTGVNLHSSWPHTTAACPPSWVSSAEWQQWPCCAHLLAWMMRTFTGAGQVKWLQSTVIFALLSTTILAHLPG